MEIHGGHARTRKAGLLQMTDPEVGALADRLAEALADNRRIQRLVKEIVLRTCAETLRDQRNGVVAGFFDACESRRVRVTLDERGHIAVSDPARLGGDLAAVLSMHRPFIKEFLEDMAAREKRELELEAKRNGTNGVHK